MAKLDSCSLSLPATVSLSSADKDDVNLTEASLSASAASCIAFWGPPPGLSNPTESTDRHDARTAQSVAIGCTDGSVFILDVTAPTSPSVVPRTPHGDPVSPPLSPRRYLGLGHASSRSASPSSTISALSPFHVTRSRIVSSVTTEQAEAPKNYVDFEDEQERLKGMLKGKEQRMRHASRSRTRPERNSFSTDRSLAATPSSPNGGGTSQKKDDARSHLSAALSPAPSTLSLSSPPSPTLFPAVSSESNSPPSTATLRYHVFPPQSSTGRPVSSIKTHDGGRYFTCLLETGALSVHCTSDGRCVASITAEVKPPPSTVAGKVQTTPPMLWVWRSLLVAASDESIAIFACASPHEFYPAGQVMESVSDSERQAIVAVYELVLPGEAQAGEASLEHLGQWPVNGQVDTIGLRAEPDHSLTLFHIGPAGHFSSRTVRVLGPLPDTPPDLPESSSAHLPLPNPFKVLKSLSTDHLAGTNKDQPLTRLELSDDVVIGEINSDFPIIGLRAHDNGDAVRWCAWVCARDDGVCDWSNDHLEQSASIPATKVRDVKWMDHGSFVALFSDRAEVWRVAAAPGGTPSDIQCQMVQSAPFTPGDAVSLAPGGHIVSTHLKDKTRRIHYLPLEPSMSRPPQSRTLWAGHHNDGGAKPRPCISYMLPLELDLIIAGHSDGSIHRTSLIDLIEHTRKDKSTSDASLSGAVVHLDIVQNPRTNERVLVGGSDDGAIAIWDISTLAVCARWTVFTTPLAQVISLHDEDVGRLHGCVLCVSQDGTVAVVAIDDYQFVYLVPGSAAPLARISLSEDNMLLVYADGRARLWDTRTREFWRSMSIEKGEELIQAGGWSQWSIGDRPETRCSLRALNHGASPDAASTLLLDISSVLRQLSATPALASSASNALSPKAKLENARAVLSMLLTFGVSEGVDSICTESLGIAPHPAPLGLSSDAVSLFPSTARSDAWTVSPEASADRALVILSLLHYLTQYEDLAQDANTVMTFYTASVGQLVLESYQPPSLPRLGQHLLNTLSSEVRHTARLLFDAGVARLSDHETTEIMDNWQNYLPTLRSEKEKESQQSALALCVCGFIAVDKYTLLTPGTLTEIAKSIALYLHDEASPYRSLAIDLCSRGFQVWQQYVDAVEMLRALFTLATTTKKEAIAAQNVGAQARTAVLQIAASNSPLFMTTLAIDILHPRSPTARRAVLQLVVFLVRKQPLVLYAGLPRLLDAVVKALDPNASAAREAALDPATEILSHIVQTFPTVDFHGPTQRLAVGTSEGAVVMHDLKTATRLYVLEGHTRRTTACSFSPDGRRLVTVSLEEAAVLVWKVGSSFTSFFLPGAPPRQGHGGSEPFKRLSFNIGEAAHMSLEETLVNVRFEWAGDRSVKLMVKDSVMTFST